MQLFSYTVNETHKKEIVRHLKKKNPISEYFSPLAKSFKSLILLNIWIPF